MMVRSKIKVKENDENGVERVKRRSTKEIDHWAFLEEIEAPMWVDLTLESMLMTDDNDDTWFHASHPFHQRSARQLRSAFSHSDVGNDYFNFNLLGVSSPKLPSSVSKSRGKDYQRRNWGCNGQSSSSKGHPVNDLGGRVSRLDEGTSQESKLKGTCENRSGSSVSVSDSNGDNSCITTLSDSPQHKADDSDTRGVFKSQSATTSEGVSTSTITTESGQRQYSKVFEISKEACGHTGGLLNALKTNLRRSCVTRPAMRLEIFEDRECKDHISSKDHKAFSGKSSVGCSNIGSGPKGKAAIVIQNHTRQRQVKGEMKVSRGLKGSKGLSNPKFEVAAGLKQNEDRDVKSRDLGSARPVKERVKVSNMAKSSLLTSNAYNSRMGALGAAAASTAQKAPKSKVTEKKSSNQLKGEYRGVKNKVWSSSQSNKLACNVKDNMRGITVSSQRSHPKDRMSVVKASDKKNS